MLNCLDKGWNVHEAPDGLTFEHTCTWNTLPAHNVSGILKEYVVKGIFEDGHSLMILTVKTGIPKLLKLSAGEEGNIVIRLMELTQGEYKQVFDMLQHPAAVHPGRQIIE